MIPALKRFDADFLKPIRPVTEAAFPNGLFTIELPDRGHRTFKVWTRRASSKFMPGKRAVGLLIGPENTKDYESVGEVTDTGFKVWKNAGASVVELLDIIWRIMVHGEQIDGYTVSESRTCLCCGRALTTPESIARGVGDHCWEKWNNK